MIVGQIKIIERGPIRRGGKAAFNRCSKEAWVAAGTMWHLQFRDDRFTTKHARLAGYVRRRGEESGIISKEWWWTYTGRKMKKWHHTNPLQWSGETRKRVRMANITSTSTKYFAAGAYAPGGSTGGGGVRIAYPGAYTLNLRPRGGRINMAEEFRRVTKSEAHSVASVYDTTLNAQLNADNSEQTTRIG